MASMTKRRETKHNQREAAKHTVSPRWLARSIAKGINRQLNQKESEISNWREMTSGLPRRGKDRIHPKRKIRKIEDGIENV